MAAESAGPAFEVHVDEEEVGERHPGAPWRPSVYEIAHRRLHRG